MLLDAWQYYQHMKGTPEEFALSSQMMGAFDLLNEKGELYPKHVQFLEQLPYYFELDHFYLVHAGFDFNSQHPFSNYSDMVWVRDFQHNPTAKTIIHGHRIKELNEISHKIAIRSSIIPLDNGCYYGLSSATVELYAQTGTRVGNLCCLNLDTYELVLQPNIDYMA
jgi:serine/threonine protein phosphatase 1